MQISERSFLLHYTCISCLVNNESITVCYTIDSTIWFLRQRSLSLPSAPERKDISGAGWNLHCDVLFLVYIKTISVASVIRYVNEWFEDLWVMMWKNYERKVSSNLRNYRGLGLEAMRQVTKTLRQDGWSQFRDLNWALTQCRARDLARFSSYVGNEDRFEEYNASICAVPWRNVSTHNLNRGGGTLWILTAIDTTKIFCLCFIVHCDGMTLPTLPLDIPVPPAALARRGAFCFLRWPENGRRHMQVRNLYCIQCVDIIVARMGSQRESGETLLISRENLKHS
jgi:hypothetical protein